jgi:DNA polymerase III subunit chi
MTEIGFYHLTRTAAEDALPPLLGRTLQAGERAVVLCRTEERLTALDDALWACAQPDWLPHGTARDGDADLQPIWLTVTNEVPNGARFLFLVEGAQADDLAAFARVFDLFDGNDPDAVAAARLRWSAALAAGHALTYWQQGERNWERKR